MRERYLDLATLNMLRDLQRDLQQEAARSEPSNVTRESGPNDEASRSRESRSSRAESNNNILQQVIQMYLDVAPGELDRMEDALAKSDYERLAAEAHQLKSNSSMVGAALVADFTRMIEEYLFQMFELGGTELDPIYLAHLVRRTRSHLNKTCQLLRDEDRMIRAESDSMNHAALFHETERGIV